MSQVLQVFSVIPEVVILVRDAIAGTFRAGVTVGR